MVVEETTTDEMVVEAATDEVVDTGVGEGEGVKDADEAGTAPVGMVVAVIDAEGAANSDAAQSTWNWSQQIVHKSTGGGDAAPRRCRCWSSPG